VLGQSVDAGKPEPIACPPAWEHRGLQGATVPPNSADARVLKEKAGKIARDDKLENMKVEVIDLGDAFAVHFSPTHPDVLGGDLTVVFLANDTVGVLRGL
jgi:hypothetical protein